MGMDVEQHIIALSRQKWHWMSRRQTDPLETLCHDKVLFVQMGATMTKDERSRSSEVDRSTTRTSTSKRHRSGS